MLQKKLPNGFVLGAYVKSNEAAQGMVIGARTPGAAILEGVVLLMCDNSGKTHLIINQDKLQEMNGEVVFKNYDDPYLPAGFDDAPIPGDTHKCRYCGGQAKGKDPDILCENCQMLFGHFRYSQL